jgi:hypothetical protein
LARLRATFHFSIRELLVDPDLLGTARELSIGDRLVRVVLPLEAADQENDSRTPSLDLDHLFPAREPAPDLPGTARTSLTLGMAPSKDIAPVRFIRVEVFFDGEISASDFVGHDQPKESPAFDSAYEALQEAAGAAREGLERLLEWIRVRGRQHWLGLGHEPPEGVGEGELVDLDAGSRLPVAVALQKGLVIPRIRDEQVLGAELFDEAVRLGSRGEEPLLADSLLADALFLAQDAEPLDLPRALLVAAIACELKIKATLREHASEAQRELVDVLLSNPRDWALSAVAHFDAPLKAVAGVSLREADRELWKPATALFERRNALAHRGVMPSDDDALDSIRTAVALFRWLPSGAS